MFSSVTFHQSLFVRNKDRGKYSGRPAKSGAHSWETSQVGGTLVGDNSGGNCIGSTLVGNISARDYTTSGGLAGNTRGDQPSREHIRGRQAKSGGHSWGPTRELFSSRFGDGPGRGRANVLARKTIENALSHSLLGELYYTILYHSVHTIL